MDPSSTRSASTRPGPALFAGRLRLGAQSTASRDGQVLEEGITQAGSDGRNFKAAGHCRMRRTGCRVIPFYILLLDVRVPANRRPDLGRRRRACPRLTIGATAGGRRLTVRTFGDPACQDPAISHRARHLATPPAVIATRRTATSRATDAAGIEQDATPSPRPIRTHHPRAICAAAATPHAGICSSVMPSGRGGWA